MAKVPPKIDERSSTILVVEDAFLILDEVAEDGLVVSGSGLLGDWASKKFS